MAVVRVGSVRKATPRQDLQQASRIGMSKPTENLCAKEENPSEGYVSIRSVCRSEREAKVAKMLQIYWPIDSRKSRDERRLIHTALSMEGEWISVRED